MTSPPSPTARIRFRRYRREDTEAVSTMFADPLARRFYPDMGEPGKADSWIAWNLDNYAAHGVGLWVIEDRVDHSFLGDCGLTYQQAEGESWLEVGYHLQEPHRGRGYATEAGRACVIYAFEVLGAPRICSIVAPGNTASIHVASRLHESHRTFINEKGESMVLYWSARQSLDGTPASAAGS
jgi:RimJ/RimL family protein N-acetyltransferase